MSELSLPPQIGGRYLPVRLIGRGGMGDVYEVEHLHTGKRFALKVLRAQPGASVERFKREARAASHIRSDHIVQVTDADVAPELAGASFLVMELLEGSDLERVSGNTPSPPDEVVDWLRQVARALAKAHDAGIVHRDLKPENIFLTQREDGSPLVKVLDFGIAKIVAEGPSLTLSGGIVGTPAYMAPEQTDNHGPPVTPQTDLYALGLIAFKLLTGRSYWRTAGLAQLLAQILADPMPPASERGSTLGEAFDAWFRRACDRDPGKRFASAVAQIEALALALGLPDFEHAIAPESAPPSSMPPSRSAPSLPIRGSATELVVTGKRFGSRPWLTAGAAAVVAGVALVGLSMRAGAPEPSSPARLPSIHSALAVNLTASVAVDAPSALVSAVALEPASPDGAAPSSSSAASQEGVKLSTGASPAQKKAPAIPLSPDARQARDPLDEPY